MNIYAIGDLHLSQTPEKSMEKFGWEDYENRIFEDWDEKVQDGDLVLIAGDISWAMRLDEAMKDLDKLHSQKGTKILVRGNHDYWWSSIKKLNSLYEDMIFIQNTIYEKGDYVICGSRLWLSPNDKSFTPQDDKIYKREQIRLENSLKLAQKTGKKIILLTHYPPTNENRDVGKFIEIIKSYKVKHMVYGHLHGDIAHHNALQGELYDTTYHLVSCDYLNFRLKKIL